MNKLISDYKQGGVYNQIMGASPHGLIVILLSTLCQQIRLNIEAIKKFNSEEFSKDKKALVKKIATIQNDIKKIVQHLSVSLKGSYDQKLAAYLRELYFYIDYQMFLSFQQMQEKPAKHGLKVAEDILNIWKAIPEEFHHVTARETDAKE